MFYNLEPEAVTVDGRLVGLALLGCDPRPRAFPPPT
jgi:hypothetical protein